MKKEADIEVLLFWIIVGFVMLIFYPIYQIIWFNLLSFSLMIIGSEITWKTNTEVRER